MELNPELIKMLMMHGPVRDPNDPRIYERFQQRMQGQPSYQMQDPMQSAPTQPTQPTAPDPETLRVLLQLLQRLQSQQTGQPFVQQTPFMR